MDGRIILSHLVSRYFLLLVQHVGRDVLVCEGLVCQDLPATNRQERTVNRPVCTIFLAYT